MEILIKCNGSKEAEKLARVLTETTQCNATIVSLVGGDYRVRIVERPQR